jgi:hypothetical protein
MPKIANQPKTKKTTPEVRPIKYPEFGVLIKLGDEALTVEEAKEFLGWTEQNAADNSTLLHDEAGTPIVCKNNFHNRPYTDADARRYAQEILNRRWADSRNGEDMTINGEPFIISRTEQVLSGQHRFVGLIIAWQQWMGLNKKHDQSIHWKEVWPEPPTMECVISVGVSDNPRVTRTLDNVKTRTLADCMYADGDAFRKDKPKDRAAKVKMVESCVRMLWARTGAKENPFSPELTHSEAIEFYNNHPHIREAVEFVYEENKNGGISKYMSPGYAAALLYLMGCSQSDGVAYRSPADEGKPRKEGTAKKGLDWSRWNKAQDFWVALKTEGEEFKALRLCRRPVVGDRKGTVQEPYKNWSGYIFAKGEGGKLAEKLAVLIKGWYLFLEGEPLEESKLALAYTKDSADDGSITGFTLDEYPTLGGIDLEPEEKEAKKGKGEKEEEAENLTPEELEERKAGERSRRQEEETKKEAERAERLAEKKRRLHAAQLQARLKNVKNGQKTEKAEVNGTQVVETAEEPAEEADESSVTE